MRATIVLLIALIVSSCSARSNCTAHPGADVDINKGETIQEKVTPKGEIRCTF